MTDADYTDDLAVLTNTPAQAEYFYVKAINASLLNKKEPFPFKVASVTWYATERGEGRSIPLPFCVLIKSH